MRRWICPTCGSGTNGPERPRKDDVRRYCLDCSASSGRLVERTCPALDRQRERSTEKAAAKRATARDRTREAEIAKRSVGGFDLLAEAKRFWRLPVMKEQRFWRKDMPTIEWRRSRSKSRTSGHCSYRPRRIVITIGIGDSADARETVLHELVHSVLGHSAGHSEVFYRVLRRAAREAWPDIEIPAPPPLRTAWHRDHWIVKHLAEGEAATSDATEPRPSV